MKNVNSMNLFGCLTSQVYRHYYDSMRRITVIFTSVSVAVSLWLSSITQAYAASNFCPSGNFSNLCNLDVSKIGQVVGTIVQVLLIIAIILSLFFLIYGGIRYISSGGDKGKIDQARGTLTAAVVGLIISLLAFFILSIVLLVITGKGLQSLTIPTLLQ
jgi:hypothetical protein